MPVTLTALHHKAERNNFLPVASVCPGMTYFVDQSDRHRIGIGTDKGAIILNRRQIKAIAEEAIEILEIHADGRSLKIDEYAPRAIRSRVRPVIKFDADGNVLGRYPNVKEAAKDNEISYDSMYRRCKNDTQKPDKFGCYYRHEGWE